MKRSRLQDSSMSSFDRFFIFNNLYPNDVELKKNDIFFSFSSIELIAKKLLDRKVYINALIRAEEQHEEGVKQHYLEMAQIGLKNAQIELKNAQISFTGSHGPRLKNLKIEEDILFGIFGSLLIKFVNEKPYSYSDIHLLGKKISEKFGSNSNNTNQLLDLFNLKEFNETKPRIPENSKKSPYPPSEMSGKIQTNAQNQNQNFIYGYPLNISTHFPIFLCHSVFGDFMDIIKDDNKENSAVKDYKKFLKSKDVSFKLAIDKCVQELVNVFLIENRDGKTLELQFVDSIVSALNKVFPEKKVRTQISISTKPSEMIKIDAGVFIGDFPFILIEAKNMNYSINAVLQGLQYYGLNPKDVQNNFIDNNPCFLMTVDHGILFIYGVATVNCRVICDCLLSLEFTNYHFGINNFLNVLYRCISSFSYFYLKFSQRMLRKDDDPVHLKYVEAKNKMTPDNQPWPAIFSVKSWKQGRIEIKFEEVLTVENLGSNMDMRVERYKANIKSNVFLVKMVSNEDEADNKNNQLALLKICFNYSIKAHDILAKKNMAPKIYGYEMFRDNCQVILMEYLSEEQNFISVFDYLKNKSAPNFDSVGMLDALKKFLDQVHSLNIVHGDFRSNNIFVKILSSDDYDDDYDDDDDDSKENVYDSKSPASGFKFKLIDFEFSGMIMENYPCLAMRNPAIEWHSNFTSFEAREHEHDIFMFNCMKSNNNN